MPHRKRNTWRVVSAQLSAGVLLLVSGQVSAQGTPAEFAELSLQELINLPIYEPFSDTDGRPFDGSARERGGWNFSYSYSRMQIDGYQDGDSNRSKQEVLWQPGETRRDDNFPVVPTEITQEVHLLTTRYQRQDWGLTLSLPYIEQSTDHISTVPGYSEFTISSAGIGDASLSGSYVLAKGLFDRWIISAGLSVPTGSIDEKGDTPRGPGDQQLPYTMQLGSGTYDIPLSISYRTVGEHQWRASLSMKWRTGKNDRGYRLGNYWRLSGQYDFEPFNNLRPYIGMSYEYREAIHGQDDELTVSGAFPYPASITNPDLYGGRQLDAKLGLTWAEGKHGISGEIGIPVYQYLHGPQPREEWQLRFKYALGI